MPMAQDPPEVPLRTRDQLQEMATPGAYLPESPNPEQMSGKEILERCSSNQWFFQGKVLKDLDLSFAAET
eukprot:15448458-Alexandrium_andersonii.AAC.1